MCGTQCYPSMSLRTLRAYKQCGFFFFFTRSGAAIKFNLQAESALENTDGEQRAIRKFFRSIITKIPEISVGSQMELFRPE